MPKRQGMTTAWFRREDWPRWLEIDPGHSTRVRRLAATEGESNSAVVSLRHLDHQDGNLAERLSGWTKANGMRVDTAERAAFAAFKAMPTSLWLLRPPTTE
jgi:hypothetical protein